jgi:hypothetical protein
VQQGDPRLSAFCLLISFLLLQWAKGNKQSPQSVGQREPMLPTRSAKQKIAVRERIVVASAAKQSSAEAPLWIASSLRSSQ